MSLYLVALTVQVEVAAVNAQEAKKIAARHKEQLRRAVMAEVTDVQVLRRSEQTVTEADENQLHAAVRAILRGFDKGVFVRSTTHDSDPGWAIRAFPFIHALAMAQQAVGEPPSVDAVDPSAADPGTRSTRE